MNPLNDYSMLEKIFIVLPVDDLKNCRLASKLWNKEATPFLRKSSMIYFNDHYDEEDDIPEDPALHDEFYLDVKNYLRCSPPFVCESYSLGRGAKYTEQQTELLLFFRQFGANIKHLRLDYEFHSHFNVKNLREYLCKFLPNISCLDIRNMPMTQGMMTRHIMPTYISNDIVGHWPLDHLPVFWPKSCGTFPSFQTIKRIELWNYNSYVGELGRNFVQDLLKVSPNLECMKIVDRYEKNITQFFLEALRDNITWAQNLNEIILDCRESPSVNDIKMLALLDRKLKTLRLGELPMLDANGGKHLQTLLDKQAPTLTELQFGNFPGNLSITVNLPIFPRLQKLEFTQDIGDAKQFNVCFAPVIYHIQFPVLKELSNCRNKVSYPYDCPRYEQIYPFKKHNYFKGMANLWKSLFPEDGQLVSTLRILDIPYSKDKKSKLTLRLSKMFPNVNNEVLNLARYEK